jgi:peptidoglycan/xylan/chitin deacetylase (PgdA/CDA1 family)
VIASPSSITAAAITVAGAAGVASWLGYQCYSPSSQFYGAAIAHLPPGKRLALTYDDGPNDPWTQRLLEVLAAGDVKATFFLIGKWVKRRPDIVREIAAAGHSIANHTFSHPNLIFCSGARIHEELSACSKAIADALGNEAGLFRPPFGARRPVVLRTARAIGLVPVLWSVTCWDWKATTADAVEGHARRQIERTPEKGHILLLHDGGDVEFGVDRSHTVEATRRLIARYRDAGFSFEKIVAAEEKQ